MYARFDPRPERCSQLTVTEPLGMLDTHVRVVVVVGCGALLVLAIARRRTMLAQNRVLPRLLEHINLNIPSQTTAREFYVGLGGAINPVSTNWRQLHINIGA